MFSRLWEQCVNKREVPPRLPWFPFWKHSGEREGLLADLLSATQQTRAWLTLWWSSPTWLIFSSLDLPGLAWLTVWLQDSKGQGCMWGRGGTKVLHLLPESPEHRLKQVSFTPFWLLKVEQIGEISSWCLWGILASCLRVPPCLSS